MKVTIPDEALAELTASDNDEEQIQPHNEEGIPEETQEVASASSQEEPETSANEDATSRQADVPYSRFSEVIAAKNAAKIEAEELRREIEELREGRYAPEEYDEYDDDDADPHSVESRLERMELKEATAILDAEVAAAREAHPGVPEAVLFKAVTEDPTLDVMVVAESYSRHIAGIEQAAIDRYLAANPAAQRVPPKLKTSGSAGSTRSKPKTLAEAHVAMRAAVRASDW